MSSANYKALVAAAVIIFFAVIALVVGLILGLREEPGGGGAGVKPGQPGMGGGSATTTPGSESETTTTTPGPDQSEERQYRFAAVASDATICAQIGTDILGRRSGSVVDAAIATALCSGVVNAHSCGIGGGFFMTVYDVPKNGTKKHVQSIMAREVAPKMADRDMYLNKSGRPSIEGGLAIGVPGEIKGYYTAWKLYGRLPWADLFAPAIKLCKNGVTVPGALAPVIERYREKILSVPGLKAIFAKPNGEILKEGDLMFRPTLASTLEQIAADPNTFYTGDLARKIISDIQEADGIIEIDDFVNYQAKVKKPVSVTLNNGGYTIFSPPPPSSGVVLDYIFNILDGYSFNKASISGSISTIETYHKIVEAFKYGYAARTQLGDEDFLNISSLIQNMTSKLFADSVRNQINPDRTYGIHHYAPQFDDTDSFGTSHTSILSPDGAAVSMTSTINYYFGSLVVGKQTGIIFNNEMDDFSTPGKLNAFGFQPSPANFIKPGKMPMSSMSPSIVLDQNGDVVFISGASGGSRIITATAWVIIQSLWFGKDLKSATDTPRLHDQLNENLYYEPQMASDIITGLKAKGHNVTERYPSAVSNSIYNLCVICKGNCMGKHCIQAASDKRKGGFPKPNGF